MTLPLVQKLGGPRNAAIAMTGVGGVAVLYIGHRRAQKNAQTAATAASAATTATGYADTSMDPTQVYTGFDQLEQQITALQAAQSGSQSGVPNPNPAPVSTSPGTPAPPAPTPAPPGILNHPIVTPGGGPVSPAPKSYKVVKGDTLSGIAQRLLGSANKWPTLYAENKAVVGSDPNLIRPGEVLKY